MFTQQFGDALMKLDMIIHVAHARLHGANQRQLFIINVFNQLSIVIIAMRRPGTGQVGCIAVVFRARIQQEATHLCRRTMIKLCVMQYGGMLVQRHNIAVRHISVAMAGRGQIGLVDIKLAHPGEESFMSSLMTVNRRLLRFTHTGQLIVSFIRAIVVQIIDRPFRVDFIRRNIQPQRTFRYRSDISDIATRGRQLAADTIRFRQGDHLHLFGPE